jgi:hypothetical protein
MLGASEEDAGVEEDIDGIKAIADVSDAAGFQGVYNVCILMHMII